jgi:transcriptional regulator of acetoin/glycerol metabolism
MVTTPGDYIQPMNLPEHIRDLASNALEGPQLESGSGLIADNEFLVDLSGMTWPGLEKAYVKALMKKYNWNITWAARSSGINRSTFASRMRKLDIRRNQQT